MWSRTVQVLKEIKMTKHILTSITLLLCLFPYTVAQYRTDGFKDWEPRKTLEGLRDIEVIVKYGQVDGLETRMRSTILRRLQDRAKDLLKQGEVPIVESDGTGNASRPRLVFTVTLKKPTDPSPVAHIESKLFQRVRLWRDPSQEMELATWSMGGTSHQIEYEALSSLLGRVTDTFVREYRAANPPSSQVESNTIDAPTRLKDGNAFKGLTGIDFMLTPRFIQIADERLKTVSETIQSEAEDRLRQAGIPLLHYAKDTAKVGYPLLNIVITFSPPNSYAPPIEVKSQFWQKVLPVSDLRKQTYAVTWELQADDGQPVTDEVLRRIVNGHVEQFIEAYKDANPKPSASLTKQ